MVSPVMNEDSSEAKNSIKLAMSCTVPSRRSGIFSAKVRFFSSSQ